MDSKNSEDLKQLSDITKETSPKPITDILEETPNDRITILGNTELTGLEDLQEQEEQQEEQDQQELLPTSTSLTLQLGDVIMIESPKNDVLNGKVFYVDYISEERIVLIDDNVKKIPFMIQNGVIGDGSIETISILNRQDTPSYARQHDLLMNTWIDIVFEEDTITGEIINLEEDSIEVKIYPTEDIIYIDFGFKGIPEELPITQIMIRESPVPKPIVEQQIQEIQEIQEERQLSTEKRELSKNVNPLDQTIFDADEVIFEDDLAPIEQITENERKNFRYGIDEQSNDLLDSMLSKVPSTKRTSKILNDINRNIVRYKQLHSSFSLFDKHNNILEMRDKTDKPFIVHDQNWKPLVKTLESFNNKLYWILLVGRNIRNIYSEVNDKGVSSDIQFKSLSSELQNFDTALTNYDSGSYSLEQNRYLEFGNEINKLLKSFTNETETNYNDIIYQQPITKDMTVLLNNLQDFVSSVSQNQEVVQKKYLFTRYSNEVTYLKQTKFVKKVINELLPLMQSDVLALTSIMTLPEATMNFSRINLPGTNMLDRANLGSHFIDYWRMFNKRTTVNHVTVAGPINYTQHNFLNDIKSFEISDPNTMNTKETYTTFLNNIVPKTRVLFDLVKKYINGRLSFVNVIECLEPFSIYSNDITYMQYKDIHEFISGFQTGKIAGFVKTLIERKKKLESFITSFSNKYPKNENLQNMIEQLNIPDSNIDEYTANMEDVDLSLFSNSERLKSIIQNDYGNLFHNIITLSNINLFVSENIQSMLSDEAISIAKQNIENPCKTYIFTKKYYSQEDLTNDNNKVIFFDKEYDDTPLEIMEDAEIVKKQLQMKQDEFLEYLILQLRTKFKYDEEVTPYLAESLMNKHRKVLDGQYAIMIQENQPFMFYVRTNNAWVLDETVPKEYSQESLLCEIQEKCSFKKTKNESKCEPFEQTIKSTNKQLLKQMGDEFEQKYALEVEQMKTMLQMENNSLNTQLIWSQTKKETFLKYNEQQNNIGRLYQEKKKIISPYEKYLNIILAVPNFADRQSYILRFKDAFTREYYPDSMDIQLQEFESPYWFYCVEKNIRLMPTFLFELADAFIKGNYNETMVRVISERGAIDDGNNWVDKYSGRSIKLIDFDTEEGYNEQGFKVATRDIIDDENEFEMIPIKTNAGLALKKYVTKESKIIYNILLTLTRNMKIAIDEEYDFIIQSVTDKFVSIIPSEDFYNKTRDAALLKDKRMQTYSELYDSTLLYLTLACFLIVTQTTIPSVSSKYSMPGCHVRSFKGFPTGAPDDMTAIKYLACVALKSKSSLSPWSVLPGSKHEDKVVEKIKMFVNQQFISDKVIQIKIKNKVQYLFTNVENDDIIEQHNIVYWHSFLPPLTKFKIKNLVGITEEFHTKLITNIKRGSPNQFDQINIIGSKILLFSYAIQEQIQKIVSKESAIFSNAENNQPMLENACCNGRSNLSTVGYFISKNNDILTNTNIVNEYSKVLNDIKTLTMSPLFLSIENTKNKVFTLTQEFTEQTIYTAFIKLCKFRTLIGNSEEIQSICGEKPNYITFEDTIIEIIQKLKADGRNYDNVQLLRLLQVINKQNTVDMRYMYQTQTNPNNVLTEFLTALDTENHSEIIAKNVQDSLHHFLETFTIYDKYGFQEDLPEVETIKRIVLKANASLRKDIVMFIEKNVSRGRSIEVLNFLTNLSEFQLTDIKSAFNLLKNYVERLSVVFPSMINNSVNTGMKVAKYWKITKIAEDDIVTLSKETTQELNKYYGDTSLKKLLNTVQTKLHNVILFANKVPFVEQSAFNTSLSFILIEHCLLLVLYEYVKLSSNKLMLKTIEHENDDENEDTDDDEANDEFEDDKLKGDQIKLQNNIGMLLSDFIKIFARHKNSVNISYDSIMDNVFKLKESEKNRVRQRKHDLTPEQRRIDNLFQELKIGSIWSNTDVRGFDGDRYEQEKETMLRAINEDGNNDEYDPLNEAEAYGDGNFEDADDMQTDFNE